MITINLLLQRIELLKQLKASLLALIAVITLGNPTIETFEEPIFGAIETPEVLQLGAAIPIIPVITNFSPEDIAFEVSGTKFATSERKGIIIPIKYNFPIATPTGYDVEIMEEDIGMSLDSYNMCRSSGKIKVVCRGELDDDIAQTVDAFKQNKTKDLDELKRESFEDELNF